MNLSFWKGSKTYGLTQVVRRNLFTQFHLELDSSEKLRALETDGKYGGRRVRLMRIFDPALLSNSEASNLEYRDLEESVDRVALQFEGHIEKNGQVRLADRRPEAPDGLEDTQQSCETSHQDRNVWLGFLEGVSSHEREGN